MPNGRGQIDCSYCVHWQGEYACGDGLYEKGFCKLHKSEIPSTLPDWNHRVCRDFEPNSHFEKYVQYNSLEDRLQGFERALKKNVLYEFPYNAPYLIDKLKDL